MKIGRLDSDALNSSPANSSLSKQSSDRIKPLQLGFVPRNPAAGPVGSEPHPVANFQRFLNDRICPVDVFEPMGGGRRAKQVRADFRHQMRRHFDTLDRGYAGSVKPTSYAPYPR